MAHLFRRFAFIATAAAAGIINHHELMLTEPLGVHRPETFLLVSSSLDCCMVHGVLYITVTIRESMPVAWSLQA